MEINTVKKINWNDILDSYKVTCVDGTICQVPIKAGNTDYQAVMAWKDEGNTIEEAD
jgi:hypothetical protein